MQMHMSHTHKADPGARYMHTHIRSHCLTELHNNLGGVYHYPGFTDQTTEAERGVLLKSIS